MNDISDKIIEACAQAAHEANRAYCLALGDTSQPSWGEAPEGQRSSAFSGVLGVAKGAGPRESHAGWLAEKEATGWKYGPVKNVVTKEHPCFVAYDDLPAAQKAKDAIFVTVVKVMLSALVVDNVVIVMP